MHGDFSGEALVPMSKLTGDLGRDAPPYEFTRGSESFVAKLIVDARFAFYRRCAALPTAVDSDGLTIDKRSIVVAYRCDHSGDVLSFAPSA